MSGWGLALRVARREAWRNRKRSALVVVMLALPVAGASAADTLWRSSQITAEQKAAWQMGGYDALVSDVGGPVYQTPDLAASGPARDAATGGAAGGTTGAVSGSGLGGAAGVTTTPAAIRTAADLTALLPAGSHVAPAQAGGYQQIQVADGPGRVWAQADDTDLADPLLARTADRIKGAAPDSADEAALSSALAGQLHKGVGDTIAVRTTDFAPAGPQGGGGETRLTTTTLHVTGVYDSKLRPYDKLVFVHPGFLGARHAARESVFPVAVPGGVDWNLTQRLNAHGFTVQSKRVIADPPPRSQVPYYRFYPSIGLGDGNQASQAVAVIALSVVVLEVVLLAGPAFAVSARRRRRDFGLLGAAGADGRRLRRIVLADGVVLGAVGGVIGAVTGIAVSAATLPWFGHFTQHALGGFRLEPLELLAAAALGIGTGMAAAIAPAITTARQDVLVALTGRRGQSATPWRLPAVGLAGVVIGSALIIGGAWHGGSSVVMVVVAGIVLAELGLVACTPILVAWSGKLGRWLPLTGRLALRDNARNRGRSAPAVAAIMAAVAGATAVAMYINSDDAQQRYYYHSQLRLGQAAAPLTDNPDSGDSAAQARADRLAEQIAAVLPTRQTAVLQGVDFGRGQGETSSVDVVRKAENRCPPSQDGQLLGADPRCGDGPPGGRIEFLTGSSSVVAGGPELLRVLLGRADPEAEAVLKAGGAVVFDKYDLATAGPKPTLDVQITKYCQQSACDQTRTDAILPAALVDSPRWDVSAVVAPGALDGYGMKFTPVSLLIDTTRMPTAEEEKRADDLVSAAGIQTAFYVERGYQSQTWAGVLALAAVAAVVMLGAAAVATGLAITDAQADLETLAAVGARPRLRRLLAGSQAAATAGLGALLGAAFGLLPAVGLLEAAAQQIAAQPGDTLSAQQTQFAPPWLYLALVVVALPVVAAVGAAGFTRSRIEMRRRRG